MSTSAPEGHTDGMPDADIDRLRAVFAEFCGNEVATPRLATARTFFAQGFYWLRAHRDAVRAGQGQMAVVPEPPAAHTL